MEHEKFYVYAATNTFNEKYYIGKTFDVDERWINHKSAARTGSPCYFHRALNKYGVDNFERSILAEVDSEQDALDLERLWIILTKSYDENVGYNLTLGGDGVRPNEATRKKISESSKGRKHTEETKKLMGELARGRKHTSESIEKMCIAQRGRVTSEETKAKQSEVRKGRFGGENHPNYGKKMPEELKEKLRKINSGKPAWNKGIPFPEESCKKMSDSQKKHFKEHPEERERLSSSVKDLWQNPEYRSKMAASQLRRRERERSEKAMVAA